MTPRIPAHRIRAPAAVLALAVVLLLAGRVQAEDGAMTPGAAKPVTVTEAWARATPGNARSTTVYLTIRSDAPDSLVGAAAAVAGSVTLHVDLARPDGIMAMRQLRAIALKPGEPVTFRPLGLHVMLDGLRAPLREGDRFPLTLELRHAGPVTTDVVVQRAGATRFAPPPRADSREETR